MNILWTSAVSAAKMQRATLLVLFVANILFGYLDISVHAAVTNSSESPSTPEPDPAPGCKAPEIRFAKQKPAESTTEAAYFEFETTQLYMPDDFTTADSDSIEHINIDLSSSHTEAAINPYQIDLETGEASANLHEDDEKEESDLDDRAAKRRQRQNARKLNKKRRSGGRRRRLENDNGESHSGRGSRYKRHTIHRDHTPRADTDKWSGAKLAAEGDVYYMHIDELLSSTSLSKELRDKLHKIHQKHLQELAYKCNIDGNMNTTSSCKPRTKGKMKNNKGRSDNSKVAAGTAAIAGDAVVGGNEPIPKHVPNQSTGDDMDNNINVDPGVRNHRRKRSSGGAVKRQSQRQQSDIDEDVENKEILARGRRHRGRHNNVVEMANMGNSIADGDGDGDVDGEMSTSRSSSQLSGQYDGNSKLDAVAAGLNDGTGMGEEWRMRNGTVGIDVATANNLRRVKRKSGKTTGALSRPKGGSDSGSKTTSRKDKAGFDDEAGYSVIHPDEEEEEEDDDEEEDSDEQVHFTEVSEIRFPGEVGPLGGHRLCKIRCIKGKWVGPLCATNEEDEHGHIKFQPLYKSCHVNRIPTHLLLSYRNISVSVGWDLPHGHSLQARCKDVGLYKLLGESRVLCSNGLWAPRMPSCVPTTLLTNFSDDSAPSIRIKIGSGSGAFEPSGMLAILPNSTIHLDCIYPRSRGTPDWSWSSWSPAKFSTGWSTVHEEKSTKYRLTIKELQSSNSGTYTCTSPRSLTNTISIIVATSTCPIPAAPVPPLALRLEGNKLGQRALYRCPQGYRVEGTANSTCLASGNWSSPPPTCHAVQCPRLMLEDPHLSLMELNTSAWGRAVFKCQWGFKLSGPPGLECEPSGVWSGPVPRCKAILCPAPLVPLNGRIGGTSGTTNPKRYNVGSLITFTCNEGHMLVGENSIICSESGFWSHPPPFCKSLCPYPGDPPNGLIAPLKFHYDSGDLLTVQCRPGFVEYSPSGPPERPKCLPDGNWSGPVPQCRSYEEV